MKAAFKLILTTTIITTSAFIGIVYTSCHEDKCKSIACAYGGNCKEGLCICLSGYEGPNCEVITRNKFIGSYQVDETGTITTHRQYALAIEADDDINYVKIKNIYNYFNGPTIRAMVVGDTITIANQQVLGKLIFGKGYITTTTSYGTGSVLTMNYEVVDSVNNLIVDDFGYYPLVYNSRPSVWTKQ